MLYTLCSLSPEIISLLLLNPIFKFEGLPLDILVGDTVLVVAGEELSAACSRTFFN